MNREPMNAPRSRRLPRAGAALCLLAAAIGLALWLAAPSAAAPRTSLAAAQAWTPLQGIPPADIEPSPTQYAFLRYTQSDLLGRVSMSMAGKRITIRWAYGQAQALKEQSFATSYWPTAILVHHATNKLFVAGKRRNGNTLLECWTVKKPLVLNGTGGGTPAIQDGAVDDITTLVDEAVQGRDMIKRLLEKQGQSSVLFAQYYDSSSICALDFSTSQTVSTLVASAAGGSGVLAFPQCARPFERWWSANHAAAGYVYVFTDDAQEKVYVIKDGDRNGTLDALLTLTGQDWISGGWSEPSSYLP